tara:strand:+ start:3779 stop:4933 length:1155 start_codon:yes stop_codon:yes gene_type:complete
MKLTKCLCCGSNISTILEWGDMPLANNYNIKEKYPLKLNSCNTCFHLQLDESVDPDILFSNYPYFSGTSQGWVDNCDIFAETALRYNSNAKSVMDIACNDGTQLDSFSKLGLKTYGVDPANNLLDISTTKGHDVVCEMFPTSDIDKREPYDILIAQNVVAHVPNPLTFLKGCKKIMHNDSYLFIATSQANMITNAEFDTIYHEHISYFNTTSMKRLVERAGLSLVDVFTNKMHGTSYIFVIKIQPEINAVTSKINQEREFGLYKSSTYTTWVDKITEKAFNTKKIIEEYRAEGYYIVGCGAAAKGITFLNLTKTKMDMIIDTTPAKWYNKVCGTKIYPFESLRNTKEEKILFVILAWNFEKEIINNIQVIRMDKNDKFMTTNSN